MIQWRLVNGNQSVPIEKFLEMVGTSNTPSSSSTQLNANSNTNMNGLNVANTINNSPILIASASPANAKIPNQNVQISQPLSVNSNQLNKNQTTINGMPVIVTPNSMLSQSQNVVIIVSIMLAIFESKRFNFT